MIMEVLVVKKSLSTPSKMDRQILHQFFRQKIVLFYEFPNGVFLKNQLFWHFSQCFDIDLKKFLQEKIDIYDQQLNI